MPAQPINIRTCDSDAIASGVAATFARAYGSALIVTTVLAEGSRPRYNVCVARRDSRRITNDTLQAYIAFASGAAAAIDFMATARQGEQRGETPQGTEYKVYFTATGVASVRASSPHEAEEKVENMTTEQIAEGIDGVEVMNVEVASATGCEFCRPAEGDPFTNRPRGEAWTCPYCNTVYSGKETS
jgi:hypothetical protein